MKPWNDRGKNALHIPFAFLVSMFVAFAVGCEVADHAPDDPDHRPATPESGQSGQTSSVSTSSSSSAASSSGQGGAGGSNSGFAFGQPITSAVYSFTDLELGDIDGDGCVDLALAGTGSPPRINVYAGGCDGTFKDSPVEIPLTTFDDFALGDIDGDGRADVLTRDTGFPPRVTVRKSAGAFTLQSPITTQVWTYDGFWVGDVNGDGRADVLTTHFGATPPTVFVWSGPGDGTLSELSHIEPPRFDAGAFGDDFFVGSFGFPPYVRRLAGDAQGMFSIGTAQNVATYSVMALGDLDGDGNTDLLTDVPGNAWVIALYAGKGGAFQSPQLFQAFNYDALRSADVDGNGKSDLILAPTGFPPQVTVWLSQ